MDIRHVLPFVSFEFRRHSSKTYVEEITTWGLKLLLNVARLKNGLGHLLRPFISGQDWYLSCRGVLKIDTFF